MTEGEAPLALLLAPNSGAIIDVGTRQPDRAFPIDSWVWRTSPMCEITRTTGGPTPESRPIPDLIDFRIPQWWIVGSRFVQERSHSAARRLDIIVLTVLMMSSTIVLAAWRTQGSRAAEWSPFETLLTKLGLWAAWIFVALPLLAVVVLLASLLAKGGLLPWGGFRQWRRVHRWAPTWLSPAAIVLGLCVFECAFGPRGSALIWTTATAILFVGVPVGSWLVHWQADGQTDADAADTVQPDDWMHREQPIRTPDEDRFGMSERALRLAQRLLSESQSVAVVGAFGTGKSSFIALVRYHLEALHRASGKQLLYCPVEGWGLSAADAPRTVLTHAVSITSDHLDTVSLRTLPASYVGALSSASTESTVFGVLSNLLSDGVDPTEILTRLDRVLGCLNHHLLIALEDLDRDPSRELLHSIASLVDRLGRMRNISCLVALKAAGDGDLIRFCRRTEHIYSLSSAAVDAAVLAVRVSLATTPQAHLSVPPDAPAIGSPPAVGIDQVMAGLPGAPEPAFVATPRQLKRALRLIHSAERAIAVSAMRIDLDDLIALCLLRAASPWALDFLQERVDLILDITAPEDGAVVPSPIEAQWTSLGTQYADATSARRLVNILFPQLDGPEGTPMYRPFGVGNPGHRGLLHDVLSYL